MLGPRICPVASEKPTRVLDFSKYRQRYVAIEVMYLGGGLHGFARQDNTENTIEVCRRVSRMCLALFSVVRADSGLVLFDVPGAPRLRAANQATRAPSAQGLLFKALRQTKLIQEDADISSLNYSRCGRTDKGVSALGQVGCTQRAGCSRLQEAVGHGKAGRNMRLTHIPLRSHAVGGGSDTTLER